ncbi:MAG TPA: PAS domain-containing protein [Candidatus Polarisedimenticolia bacterium]|nr:PAS domain-containing protein [Candidatus Polarisedimenticolia bacterium]
MPRPIADHRLKTLRIHHRKVLRLCGLAAEIAKLGDERATLRKIVNTAASLIGVQSAHLALVDKEERTLYGIASSGRHPPNAPGLRVDLSHSPAAQEALKRRKPISIDRAAGDPRVNSQARRALSIGGVTYLPLLSGSQSFGLLILVTRRPHAWSREELTLAQHFANFASVALENVRLLKQLAETQGQFKSLVEHIPAIVYICDVEPPYRSIYVSPQIEAMLGYPSSEWINDPNFWMKIIHPDDVRPPADLEDETIRTTGFISAEYRIRDRLGEIRWMREEAVLVRDPAGAPIGWHGVLIEITGLKRMEQDLPALPPEDGLRSPRVPQA